MQGSIVFRDESGAEGGTAHPTQDLISELEHHMEVKEVPVRHTRSSNPLYWYRLGQRASDGSDVVHVQFEYGTFGSLGGLFLGIMYPFFALGVSVPMVATFFNLKDRKLDFSSTDPMSVLETIVLLLKSPIDWSIIANTDYFIPFIREHERLLEEKGAPTKNVERFPFVAEPNPAFEDPDQSKKEYGVDGKRVITAFGWVRESKGYHHVIDALPHLPEDTVFLVAGGTRIEEQEQYLEELREQTRELGVEDRVVFTGYAPRSEHATIMSATDVMVFPYQDNRPSAALALALSYKLPIVASDSEVFRTFEEEWGCVSTFSAPNELVELLNHVFRNEDELERLRQNATEYVEEVNPRSFASRLNEIYRNLAEQS
ncbi:glycosyltransferase [Halobacterium sp. KA-6]|uniref:glycosyltransferase n=1 Tax=Halobacterium sp. KA-6 TaxID=2896368 RepID=UPI001E450D2F|nr:glycosyltransferase [Halobacterium sp. KA-6]MCD2205025.1 glycosyltransferase [Halobacterium sp. KA-6]